MSDKICSRCKIPKPATVENFCYRSGKYKGLKKLDSTCRECVRERDRNRPPRHHAKGYKPPAELVGRKLEDSRRFCSACLNLSWRRPVDARCKCGGVYSAETRAELMVRRHYELAV